jgi:2-polyprenyl-3-methyl-5-hydroxy-6-metoxy-1,4-benzoquinol methylase
MHRAYLKLLHPSLLQNVAATTRELPLHRRERTPEVMDQPDLDPRAHERALRAIARTNAWGATRRVVGRALLRLARRRGLTSLRLLDAACGAGDLALWLGTWLARRGVTATVDGYDVSATAVAYATRLAAAAKLPHVRFYCHDVVQREFGAAYDCVVSSLFLHHLAEDDGVQFLRRCAAAARHAVLVDDLSRSQLGFALAWTAGRTLTRSPIVRVDAPLSVRSAFRPDEAKALFDEAGLQGATVRKHWPERYLIMWEKPWTALPAN